MRETGVFAFTRMVAALKSNWHVRSTLVWSSIRQNPFEPKLSRSVRSHLQESIRWSVCRNSFDQAACRSFRDKLHRKFVWSIDWLTGVWSSDFLHLFAPEFEKNLALNSFRVFEIWLSIYNSTFDRVFAIIILMAHFMWSKAAWRREKWKIADFVRWLKILNIGGNLHNVTANLSEPILDFLNWISLMLEFISSTSIVHPHELRSGKNRKLDIICVPTLFKVAKLWKKLWISPANSLHKIGESLQNFRKLQITWPPIRF